MHIPTNAIRFVCDVRGSSPGTKHCEACPPNARLIIYPASDSTGGSGIINMAELSAPHVTHLMPSSMASNPAVDPHLPHTNVFLGFLICTFSVAKLPCPSGI